MFDRTKDWADIEEIVAWDPAVARRGLSHLGELVDHQDRIYLRLKELLPR
jgi:hypothetical protein